MSDLILSTAHLVIRVNGHTMQAPAAEERPFEFPSGQDLVTYQEAPDGSVYGMSMPLFGGPMTFRLQPTSPSTKWFIRERGLRDAALRNGNPLTSYNGSYRDPAEGRVGTLRNGFLLQAPQMYEPGVTYEAIIYFPLIIPNVDGARDSVLPGAAMGG